MRVKKDKNEASIRSNFVSVACPLCNWQDAVRVADEGQFGLPTYVSICRGCGLVYLTPRWSAERYQRFYRDEYDALYRPAAAQTGSEHRARETVKRLEGVLPDRPGAVLDIGSGDGAFLRLAGRRWPDVRRAAIEAAEPAVATLESEKEIHLLDTDLNNDWQAGREGTFDLVVLRHVLEHALDPVKLLRKVRSVLTDTGSAYLAVPDMMDPEGSLADYWFRVVHTFYFSEQTLARFLSRADLQPVDGIRKVHAELWTVVQPGVFEPSVENVFDQQMTVIRRKIRRERLLTPLARALRRLAGYVPDPLRRLLPWTVRRRFGELMKGRTRWRSDPRGSP